MGTLSRLPDVMARTAMSRSAIYAQMERGAFPKPIKLVGARANAWLSDEIDSWIKTRIAERDAA